MITFYFVINALETFALAVYMASVGSEADTSVVFNLSITRLLLVVGIALVAGWFTYLAFRARNSHSRSRRLLEAWLRDERKVCYVFLAGAALAALMLFLLTRQTNSFGDLKLIYQRFEPVIVWLAVIGAQTAFCMLVWYCAHYIKNDHRADFSENLAELLPLFGVYVLFVLVKLALVASTAYGPLGRGDEMTYFDMAESFYRGFFSVAQSHHYPPLYPLSLVPALVFKGCSFEGIKLLNVLYSSSIVFPIYFIARFFLTRRQSLIAVLLTCLVPYHLVFPRRILSENLFFPLFVWAVLITFVVPRSRRMRLSWDIFNGAMLAVLYLTRFISLAAIPFFLLAWWIKPFEGEKSLFRPGMRKILHLGLLLLACLVVFSPWLVAGLSEDVALKLILGFGVASKTDPAQLTLGRLLVWIVLYACYYILVSAPVLNLLLAALSQIDLKHWREGLGRLIFLVLSLMAGFFLAVTRHSWRAYYNRDIPTKIMGRYLIVYSVLYIVVALIVLVKFDRARIRSKFRFVLWTVILPFALIVFSNYTLIQGAVFATDGNLLKALGSVDGFLTEILGPYFFILIAVIYVAEIVLIFLDEKKSLVPVLVAGLIVYYLSGIPSYYQDLMEYQTYPWLAKQIAAMVPPPDIKNPYTEKITVFVAQDFDSKDKAEIYNSLRVRGVDNSEVMAYHEDNLAQMSTDKGFIIREVAGPDEISTGQRLYEFNGDYFTIQEIDR